MVASEQAVMTRESSMVQANINTWSSGAAAAAAAWLLLGAAADVVAAVVAVVPDRAALPVDEEVAGPAAGAPAAAAAVAGFEDEVEGWELPLAVAAAAGVCLVTTASFSRLSPVIMLRQMEVHLRRLYDQIREVPSLLPERNLQQEKRRSKKVCVKFVFGTDSDQS